MNKTYVIQRHTYADESKKSLTETEYLPKVFTDSDTAISYAVSTYERLAKHDRDRSTFFLYALPFTEEELAKKQEEIDESFDDDLGNYAEEVVWNSDDRGWRVGYTFVNMYGDEGDILSEEIIPAKTADEAIDQMADSIRETIEGLSTYASGEIYIDGTKTNMRFRTRKRFDPDLDVFDEYLEEYKDFFAREVFGK